MDVVAVWRVPTSRWFLRWRSCGRGGQRRTRRGRPRHGRSRTSRVLRRPGGSGGSSHPRSSSASCASWYALTRSRAARRSALVPTFGRYRVLARPGSGWSSSPIIEPWARSDLLLHTAESGAHVVDEFAAAGRRRISGVHWPTPQSPQLSHMRRLRVRQRAKALPTERDCPANAAPVAPIGATRGAARRCQRQQRGGLAVWVWGGTVVSTWVT